jgi:hypothetical protein
VFTDFWLENNESEAEYLDWIDGCVDWYDMVEYPVSVDAIDGTGRNGCKSLIDKGFTANEESSVISTSSGSDDTVLTDELLDAILVRLLNCSLTEV